jgi:hypothetical protein
MNSTWFAGARGNLLAIPCLIGVAACSLLAPSADPTSPVALYFENRGGPALEVTVNGIDVVAVPCDGGATLIPGEGGIPALPWAMAVRRSRGDVVVFSGVVERLPGWFVQVGDTVLGLGFTPVGGPAGPSCPAG